MQRANRIATTGGASPERDIYLTTDDVFRLGAGFFTWHLVNPLSDDDEQIARALFTVREHNPQKRKE